MKKNLSIWSSYVYSSLHIAVIGGFNYVLLHVAHEPSRHLINNAIWVAICIFTYYNLSRIARILDYQKIQSNPHLLWISKNLTELIFALGFCLYVIILLKPEEVSYVSLGYLSLVGISYLYFRSYPYLKNVLVIIPWMYMYLIPDNSHEWWLRNLFLCTHLLFLSLWYDEKDTSEHISPIKSILCYGLIGISSILILILYELHIIGILIAILFFALHIMLFRYSVKNKREVFYLWVVDSLIITQGIICYIGSIIQDWRLPNTNL